MNNRISLFVSSSSNEWLYNGYNLFIIGYINYNLYKIMKIIVDYAQILTNEKSTRFLESVFVNISSLFLMQYKYVFEVEYPDVDGK